MSAPSPRPHQHPRPGGRRACGGLGEAGQEGKGGVQLDVVGSEAPERLSSCVFGHEPWGERAFQVTDPNGVIVQLLDWNARAGPLLSGPERPAT